MPRDDMPASQPPLPHDLPVDVAVDLAYRLARVVLDQMLPTEDQGEARRRLATMFVANRALPVRAADWRKP